MAAHQWQSGSPRMLRHRAPKSRLTIMTTSYLLNEVADQAKARVQEARAKAKEAQREAYRLEVHWRRLVDDLKKGKEYELVITDHAIVRYVERHLGFDVQEFVALMQKKLVPAAAVLGDGDFPLTDGLVAVVRNKTVITIKPA